MSHPAARRREMNTPDAPRSTELVAFANEPQSNGDTWHQPASEETNLAVETALAVKRLDKLISGRMHDLDILKALAGSLKTGPAQADIHRQLLALARSAREAFQALQSSRDALIALHRKSLGGEIIAVFDNITGLPNRASFEARLDDTFRKSIATSDTVLMLIEIGALPVLASEMGAKAANKVVRRFASVLRKTVKRTDFIARVGTQHFAIIFEHMLPENAAAIGLRIHDAMDTRLVPGGDPVIQMLSITIGITGNKPEDQSWADLFQRARHSLLLARKQVGAGIYIG